MEEQRGGREIGLGDGRVEGWKGDWVCDGRVEWGLGIGLGDDGVGDKKIRRSPTPDACLIQRPWFEPAMADYHS